MGSEKIVRHLPAGLEEVVLVCRKCSRKLGGGFGPEGDRPLAKALRGAMEERLGGTKGKARRRRRAVLDVPCLDLCPKKAVVALRADRPGDWVVIPEGTPVAEVLDHLGFTMGPPTGSP